MLAKKSIIRSGLNDSLTGRYVSKDFIIYCELLQIPKPLNYSTYSKNF